MTGNIRESQEVRYLEWKWQSRDWYYIFSMSQAPFGALNRLAPLTPKNLVERTLILSTPGTPRDEPFKYAGTG